jgi:hypothetical protein
MNPKRSTVEHNALRPAADLAPVRARPVLALVLALLSVPGPGGRRGVTVPRCGD